MLPVDSIIITFEENRGGRQLTCYSFYNKRLVLEVLVHDLDASIRQPRFHSDLERAWIEPADHPLRVHVDRRDIFRKKMQSVSAISDFQNREDQCHDTNLPGRMAWKEES
jgi:hypothetical protein